MMNSNELVVNNVNDGEYIMMIVVVVVVIIEITNVNTKL